MKLSAPLLLRLKAATRLAIEAAGGLCESAHICGLSTTHLSRCQSVHHPDVLAVGGLLLLSEYCGTAAFADLFAGLSGHRLSPLEPQGECASVPAAINLLSEAAEMAHVIGQSLSDGVISPREEISIRRVMVDLEQALAALKGAMPQAARPPVAASVIKRRRG